MALSSFVLISLLLSNIRHRPNKRAEKVMGLFVCFSIIGHNFLKRVINQLLFTTGCWENIARSLYLNRFFIVPARKTRKNLSQAEDTVQAYTPICGSFIILADRVQKMFLTIESAIFSEQPSRRRTYPVGYTYTFFVHSYIFS